VLDYYEAVGQPFDVHVNWLKANDYGTAICVLPHDGVKHDTVYAVTPEGFLSKAGFRAETVKNQGAGAALKRIDAARAVFPFCRFSEATTEGGRDALGWYHERRDEHRKIGLGPEHDWSSHAADSFGLMAIYRETRNASIGSKPIRRMVKGVV
jgi:phage terminase large subunit